MVKKTVKQEIQVVENNQTPLRFNWTTADEVSAAQLKRHLCELGKRSEGKYCITCESQCAFGRRYLLVTNTTDKTPKFNSESQKLARKCQAYLIDGTVIKEWDTVSEASKELGVPDHRVISRAISNGTMYRDMYWRWVSVVEDIVEKKRSGGW